MPFDKSPLGQTIKHLTERFNQLIDDLLSTLTGKGASQIGVEDSTGRYASTNVEDGLAEIAGAGRTTETVKGNKDALDAHKPADDHTQYLNNARHDTPTRHSESVLGQHGNAVHDPDFSEVGVASGKIAALAEKTTPVDADIQLIEDSAVTNAPKKLSWANIKATLKAYFDTLYLLLTAKAVGTDINTGTDDAKYTTSKAIEDSRLWRTLRDADKDTTIDVEEIANANTIVGKVAGIEALRVNTDRSAIFKSSFTTGLPAPSNVTTTVVSGGTLADGTYYYKVFALDSAGLAGAGSIEVNATTASPNSSIRISWDAVPGASSYRIYGRATEGPTGYFSTTETSYTDTGGALTSGNVPSSDILTVLGGKIVLDASTGVIIWKNYKTGVKEGFIGQTSAGEIEFKAGSGSATGDYVFENKDGVSKIKLRTGITTPEIFIEGDLNLQAYAPGVGTIKVISGLTESLIIHTSGIVDLPKQSSIRVFRTAIQTIPTATFTKVQFTSESWDTQNEYNTTNHRWTATKPGKVSVVSMVRYMSVIDQVAYVNAIYKNGVMYSSVQNHASGTDECSCLIVDTVSVVAGDYIEIFTMHTSGVAKDIRGESWSCFLAITKLL